MAAEEEEYWGADYPIETVVYEDTPLHKRIPAAKIMASLHTEVWAKVHNVIEAQYEKNLQQTLNLQQAPSEFMSFSISMEPLLKKLKNLQTYTFPAHEDISNFFTGFTQDKIDNFYIQEVSQVFIEYFRKIKNTNLNTENMYIALMQQKALEQLTQIEARIQTDRFTPHIRISPQYLEGEALEGNYFFKRFEKICAAAQPSIEPTLINYLDSLKNLAQRDYSFIDFEASTFTLNTFEQTANGITQEFKISKPLRATFTNTEFCKYSNIVPEYFEGQKNFSSLVVPYTPLSLRKISQFFQLAFKYSKSLFIKNKVNATPITKTTETSTPIILSPVEQQLLDLQRLQTEVISLEVSYKITKENAQKLGLIFEKTKILLTQADVYERLSTEQRYELHKNYPDIFQKTLTQCVADQKNFQLTGQKDPALSQLFGYLEDNLQDMFTHSMRQDHKETAVLVQYLKAKKR